jgi:uncharacterized PurR-regulated membrane protein YhhQ (DUF165 family)
MDWAEAKTVFFWWVGWSVLDWLWKWLLGVTFMTSLGLIVSRYRESEWQREIRGALISLTIVTMLVMAGALYHESPQATPMQQVSTAAPTGPSVVTPNAVSIREWAVD